MWRKNDKYDVWYQVALAFVLELGDPRLLVTSLITKVLKSPKMIKVLKIRKNYPVKVFC